jgi:hypothetical protein
MSDCIAHSPGLLGVLCELYEGHEGEHTSPHCDPWLGDHHPPFESRKSSPFTTVSCPVCWVSLIEDHYIPHYQWHLRMGHIEDADSVQQAT